MKKYKNQSRLLQALYHSAACDPLAKFIEIHEVYLKTNPIENKTDRYYMRKNVLHYALKSLNRPVCDYLADSGHLTSFEYVIDECDYNKIKDIYVYIIDKFGPNSFVVNNEMKKTKSRILDRLLAPNKTKDDPNRIEVALDMLNQGFFTTDEVLYSAKLHDKKGRNYPGLVLQLIREKRLTELGI